MEIAKHSPTAPRIGEPLYHPYVVCKSSYASGFC
jgi:hypothetical protein